MVYFRIYLRLYRLKISFHALSLKEMLKLRRLFTRRLIQNFFRDYGSELAVSNEGLSVRQRAWQDAQQKYAKFAPQIVYSSYIEKPETIDYQESRYIPQDFPLNWMDDYEFYDGSINEERNIDSKHGTANPSIPPSKVPCNGCGAHLHCASISLPGYIPKEIFMGRTEKELRTITCQRCHFLKNYNIALDVEVTADTYIQTLTSIKDKFALALVIVDLLDFPCSIWPGMQELLGKQRPIIVVGNKVDLLPRDSAGYLERVKMCLKEQMMKFGGFEEMNIKHVGLISAKTGYGIEELVTQLFKIWRHKGDVYLMGCANVGKSTLFNILLNSDYCRPEASDLVRRATTCPWPGTTLQMLRFPIMRPSDIRIHLRFKRLFSESVQRQAEEKLRRDQAKQTGSVQAAQLMGRVVNTFKFREEVNDTFAMSSGTNPISTLNERSKEYREAKWCYDTPGVLHPDQFADLLTTEELFQLQSKEMIRPRAFRLNIGMSIFLGGIARLDFIDCSHQKQPDFILTFVFSSLLLPVVISPTEHASDMYNKYLGTKILGLPMGTKDRLSRWPGLMANPTDFQVIGENSYQKGLTCDIVLSSAGWLGMDIPEGAKCVFRVWTPRGKGAHLRIPPLVPFAKRLIGKRIKYSLAYNMSRPFVFNK